MTESRGLRAGVLRRICLGLTLVGVVATAAYHPSVEAVLFAWIVLLVYGGLIAGAVQHVYRSVRVGRAETVTMIVCTLLFVLAVLLAPRSWIVDAVRTGHAPDGTSYPYPVRLERHGSPLLSLFGQRPADSPGPWFAVAAALALLSAVAVCVQWVLVHRLGVHRRGVLDDGVGTAGLSSAATLSAPAGSSITRPVDPRSAVWWNGADQKQRR